MENSSAKKTVKIFAWASFLNDMGSDMIYPIWPLFVRTALGADMAVLGFIDGLGDAIVALSQAGSGYWSDKLKKRKIFIWTGYLFGSISRFGYAISTTWVHLIPFRVLDRAGKIRGAPRDAMVADLSTKENRGANFGLLRTMDNLGAVVGILICIAFFGLLGYRNLFMLAAIPSAIGAILIFTQIKEVPPQTKKEYPALKFKDLTKDFWLFLVVSAFFGLGAFSYSFLLIYAKEFGFHITFIPVLYLIFTFSASLFSLPFGKFSDKIGRRSVVMFSFFLWAVTALVFIRANSVWMIITGFVLYGMHKAALDTVQKAFVSELAPVEFRATGLGLFQVVVGLCALPASLIAGLLWDKMDKLAPMYFSLGLTFVAMVLLNFVKEK
jgi:MFS family permease